MMRLSDPGRRAAATLHSRRARRGEAGLTLIEMLVALAVISVAVVGIAYGFSAVVRSSGEAQTQASLDGAARYVADYLQPKAPVGYQACATTTTYPAPAVPAAYRDEGVSWAITSVVESSTVSLPGFSPQTCTTGFGGRGRTSGYDYGVQEISITVSKGSISLGQVVWKEAVS